MASHPKRKLTHIAATVALTLALPISVTAADLKENIAIEGKTVSLGDLFTETGDKSEIAVLEAPQPGKSRYVSAGELTRIATKYEIDWQRPDYLRRISLMRLSDSIQTSDLSITFLNMAIDDGANPDSEIRLLGRNDVITVPVGATLDDIKIASFTLTDRKDRFSAVLQVPSGSDVPVNLNLSGVIEEVREIPVFNRSVMPGEVIKLSDLTWTKFPAKRLTARAVLNSADLVGMTVKRPARTDKPITTADIVAPIAIAKGDAVTMMVRSKAMILTAAGKALENGGIGDTIRVLNPKSRQTVDAKIIRSGQVEILAGPTLALGSR
ncbi:MAG: flagellar basal body P-ring formation protein FlgA [Kordiimonadaceae bacterium]|nr:flagellar basal body P-ring formation protein FlgA [Kordiimonadaceae bacterium]MBO6570678.1 flagellar basal body P-ring formation protein FlgA [Kordiimonadaceae bacterium]MBO6966464.1 flagellar basal body P-ring formation protein FlgA [Kordiimonadaceae bacterium]